MDGHEVDDYQGIREQLSVLKNINMPAAREHEITDVLTGEIEAYRRKARSRHRRRRIGWIGSASAAVAVAGLVIGAILVTHGQLGQPVGHTTASQQSTSTVTISYTSAQRAQVKSVAQAVGVTPWIPKQGLTGDSLTIVKNGGKGSLILDYKNIWVIEGASPVASPSGVTATKTLTMGNTPAEYITAQNQQGQANSFLCFQKGSTYITIENLQPGQWISMQAMRAIGESFEGVQ